ncbi:MAG: hypothetical protein KGS72_24430 [Cyanobacteria bacterium REEB67]|nr:hypothetical protein [Cyanobacteria bacterium REEB67]
MSQFEVHDGAEAKGRTDIGTPAGADLSVAARAHEPGASAGQPAGADRTMPLSGPDAERQAYVDAQAAYQKELAGYWHGAEASKHAHKKVEDFPPFYHGPEKPAGFDPPKIASVLPSVNDMISSWDKLGTLTSSRSNLPKMTIDEVPEVDFKGAYAREVINVGAQHGLDREQTANIAKNIYAFEDAGKGTADQLSGVPMSLTAPDAPGTHANRDARREIHPLSTAIGYNQLLMATSLRFVDGSHAINDRLDQLAKDEAAKGYGIDDVHILQLQEKSKYLAAVQGEVHKAVMEMGQTDKAKYLDAQGNPTYALYTDFAKSLTPTANGMSGRQMTSAVQALNLDGDIGPVLQAQQFDDIIAQGVKPSFQQSLQDKVVDDAGRAKQFDALSDKEKQAAVKEVSDLVAPTAANGAAATTAGVKLDAALKQFAGNENTDLSAMAIGAPAHDLLVNKVLALKKRGEESGPLSPAAANLVDKLFSKEMHGPSVDNYLPAAVELANLSGAKTAEQMLQRGNAQDSTVNYFSQSGYQGNPIVKGRSADELVKAIYRNMHGPNGSPDNWGMVEMNRAFEEQ